VASSSMLQMTKQKVATVVIYCNKSKLRNFNLLDTFNFRMHVKCFVTGFFLLCRYHIYNECKHCPFRLHIFSHILVTNVPVCVIVQL
jgi:hypothetical protein